MRWPASRYPDAQVIELDLAPSMLRVSRDKQASAPRGLLGRLFRRAEPWQLCADIERLLAAGSVDMIWSNLAIQWVNTPDAVFAGFTARAAGGRPVDVFSTLGPDTLNEAEPRLCRWIATHVNRFIDMHDIGDALVRRLCHPVMDMEKSSSPTTTSKR